MAILERTSISTGFRYAAIAIPVAAAVSFLWRIVLVGAGYEVRFQQVVEKILGDSTPRRELVLIVLVAVLISPIVEELLFRRMLLECLLKVVRREWVAIAVDSAIFAFIHFNLAVSLPIFVASVFFCLSYRRAGSVVASVITHMLFNLSSIALAFLC